MTYNLWSVSLPCILKTIWCMNIIIWDYEPVLCDVWPKNNCHCDPYFMAQWFCVISWSYLIYEQHTLGIMHQYDQIFDLKLNIGHCDLYLMVQWFCLTSWRLFDVWTSYFRIIGQYDRTFDLKINVGHCDLYFMVQWFCLVYEDYLILCYILKTIWCMT